MDKKAEEKDISIFLKKHLEYEIIEIGERPDFILRNNNTGDLIGVEHTEYFPHRDNNGRAIVLKGRTMDEKEKSRFSLFEEFDLGYIRFADYFDVRDFSSKVVVTKEVKLEQYQHLHPECKEFWLMVKLSFFDDVVLSKDMIDTKFNHVFLIQEPEKITEIKNTHYYPFSSDVT